MEHGEHTAQLQLGPVQCKSWCVCVRENFNVYEIVSVCVCVHVCFSVKGHKYRLLKCEIFITPATVMPEHEPLVTPHFW